MWTHTHARTHTHTHTSTLRKDIRSTHAHTYVHHYTCTHTRARMDLERSMWSGRRSGRRVLVRSRKYLRFPVGPLMAEWVWSPYSFMTAASISATEALAGTAK